MGYDKDRKILGAEFAKNIMDMEVTTELGRTNILELGRPGPFRTVELLKSDLERAADRDILVYDSDAVKGVFTARLGCLMGTIMERNTTSPNDTKMTTLYLSLDSIADLALGDDVPGLKCEDGRPTHLFGAELIPHEFFTDSGKSRMFNGEKIIISDAVHYFCDELKCGLAHVDIGLALGTTDGGQVLVGSY